MMPVDRDLVRRKLASISANLVDLESVRGLGLAEYRGNRMRKKGVERMLQESVEAAVDANQHLLRNATGSAANDYFESFTRLGAARVIPADLANQLAPAAGLRNRLVHEYDVIDDSVVLDAVRSACELFPRYIAAVQTYLTREESTGEY